VHRPSDSGKLEEKIMRSRADKGPRVPAAIYPMSRALSKGTSKPN